MKVVSLDTVVQAAKKILVAPSGEWMLVADQHGGVYKSLPGLLEGFADNMPLHKIADMNVAKGMSWITLRSRTDTLTLNGRTITATHALVADDGSGRPRMRYVSDQAFVVGGGPITTDSVLAG